MNIEYEADRGYMRWIWLMNLLVRWVRFKKAWCAKRGRQLKTNTLFFDGFGEGCRKIKEGAKSWRALDVIYNHPFKDLSLRMGWKQFCCTVFDNFWIGMMNAQAVRNRHKIARVQIVEAVRRLSIFYPNQPIRLMSVAAGSAQGVIEAVSVLHKEGIRVEVLLIDNDQSAVDYALRSAREHQLENCFQARVMNVVKESRKVAGGFQPHLIEMMGLTDYLPASLATRVIRDISASLPAHGVFMTCNIFDNPERSFLTEVINWNEMIYRTEEELLKIVSDAGLVNEVMHVEPLGIHGVVVAEKAPVPSGEKEEGRAKVAIAA